jgi:hypothetical protein
MFSNNCHVIFSIAYLLAESSDASLPSPLARISLMRAQESSMAR